MKKTIRRRRLAGKTDYQARLVLLNAGKPRLVLRRTNSCIITQIVVSEHAQDRVVVQATSSELLNIGWPQELKGSLKSRAAGYLTGFLLIKKTQGKIHEAIVDIGMHRNVHKSRLYAALKGALDAGLHVPHDESVLPDNQMIEGNAKLKNVFIQVKENINK